VGDQVKSPPLARSGNSRLRPVLDGGDLTLPGMDLFPAFGTNALYATALASTKTAYDRLRYLRPLSACFGSRCADLRPVCVVQGKHSLHEQLSQMDNRRENLRSVSFPAALRDNSDCNFRNAN
jgi:hypothetical protein